MAVTTSTQAVVAPVPMTQGERSLAAAGHADRAHALLAEAEAALANTSPGKVTDVMAHRVDLARAHAQVSQALAGLVLPDVR